MPWSNSERAEFEALKARVAACESRLTVHDGQFTTDEFHIDLLAGLLEVDTDGQWWGGTP